MTKLGKKKYVQNTISQTHQITFLFKNTVTIKMRYFSFRIYRKFNFHLLASRINNICSIANTVSSPNWYRSFKQIISYLVYSNLLVFVVSYGILKFQFIENCIGGAISCKKFLKKSVIQIYDFPWTCTKCSTAIFAQMSDFEIFSWSCKKNIIYKNGVKNGNFSLLYVLKMSLVCPLKATMRIQFLPYFWNPLIK